jgi:predicted RNA-binding Zn ribbon-like protein
MPVATLVELVNGWGSVPRASAGARARPPLREFTERHAVQVGTAAVTAAALERTADDAYEVFAADDAAERARLVSDLLSRAGVRPALRVDGDGLRPAWLVPRPDDALPAAVAVALHAQLVRHGPERLGTCGASGCGDVFVDASPGAHRRFCSITCQNRERVAAFRRRRSSG